MTTRRKSLQISDNHSSLTNISTWFLAGRTVYKIPMRTDIESASQNIKILKTFFYKEREQQKSFHSTRMMRTQSY